MTGSAMFQSFDETARPEQGPPRLEALRAEMAREGIDGFLVPRADAHQGEYVAPRDERLAWLTGFTGSAGFAWRLRDQAGVFVDGRYRVQVKAQVADVFTPVDWPETRSRGLDRRGSAGRRARRLRSLAARASSGLRKLEGGIGPADVVRCENLIDRDLGRPARAAAGPGHRATRGTRRARRTTTRSQRSLRTLGEARTSRRSPCPTASPGC